MPENPGVGRRMRIFERDPIANDLEDIDDFESDFFDVHHSQKDVEKELAAHQERLGHWIVKNKYFKSHSVNLLTYSEKEQIRHLHDSDKDEWTVEKLAASFPATEETIRKLIRSKWLPSDSKRIENHDKKVQRNWEALKENRIPEMNEELRKHLLPFGERQVEPQPPKNAIERDLPKLPIGEFSSIITSCRKVTAPLAIKASHNETLENDQKTPNLNYGSNTIVFDGVKDRRPLTIELFRDASGMLQPAKDSSSDKLPAQSSSTLSTALGSRTAKVELSPVPSQFETQRKMVQFQDKITIPRKLQRRGATYKIDDSYFDDDGEFLYRVPGMTK